MAYFALMAGTFNGLQLLSPLSLSFNIFLSLHLQNIIKYQNIK